MTGPRLGVCSWSLRPSDPRDLAAKVHACGVDSVQLALDPLRGGGAWDPDETAAILRDAGITIASGMMAPTGEDYSTLETIRDTGGIRPDATWPANLEAAKANAAIARRLGLALVTFHAGAFPEDESDPLYARMIDRLRAVADTFAAAGVRVGLETGQEPADRVVRMLDRLVRTNVGVNFDPANMILYGNGEPIPALRRLAPWVLQVHMKDARPTDRPGTWGTEVPAGEGSVDWAAFFDEVARLPRRVDVMIEREAGDSRVGDVSTAAVIARRLMAGGRRG